MVGADSTRWAVEWEYRRYAVSAARSQRGLLAGLFIVFLVACAVYAPAVTYGFAYDDSWTITNNRALDFSLFHLAGTLLGGHAKALHVPDATRPWMVTSLWIDRRLFDGDAAGYHLHSLLLYGACASMSSLAVFALVRKWSAAIAGGVLFAVAPVHAETVAAVNYREDLFAGIAVIGALAFIFWPWRREPPWSHIALATMLFVVGLFGKESTVAFWILAPAVAALRGSLLPWMLARKRLLGSLGIVSLLWATWRAWMRFSSRDDVPLMLVHRGVVDRVLRTARYLTRLTASGLFPVRWAPDYAPEGPASPAWLLSCAAILGVVLWLAKRRERALASGLAVAALAGLPTSPLLSPINETTDRYALISVLGGAIIWGALFARVRGSSLLRRAALWLPALALAFAARRAAAPWQDDLSLWTVGVERAPLSPRAWTGLSRARRLAGDLDGADAALTRAIALDPTFLRARVTAVYNALARGAVDRAKNAIGVVDRLGGHDQMGMKRARHCVELPPRDAITCSGGSANSGTRTGPGAIVDTQP